MRCDDQDFEWADDFSQGRVVVRAGSDRFGLIDRAGQWILRPVNTHARRFSEGLAIVQVGGTHDVCGGGKLGYVDRDGRVAIPPRFDAASSFSGGMAAVGLDRKWGFIDRAGKIVLAPQFDRVCDFSVGLAQAVMERGGSRERLYIDKTGRVIGTNSNP